MLWQGLFLMLGETVTYTGGIYKMMRELRELRLQGKNYFAGSGADFLENMMSSVFCFFLLMAVVLGRFWPHSQDAAWALAGYNCLHGQAQVDADVKNA